MGRTFGIGVETRADRSTGIGFYMAIYKKDKKREAADGIRTHDLLMYRAVGLTNQPLYRAKPRRRWDNRHIAAVLNLSVAIILPYPADLLSIYPADLPSVYPWRSAGPFLSLQLVGEGWEEYTNVGD